MKRSFGYNRRMGGEGMIRRSIGRAVGVNGGGGGVQESVTRTANKTLNNILSVSASSSSSSSVSAYNTPVSVNSSQSSPLPTWISSSNNNSFYDSDVWDWETIDGVEDGFHETSVFGSVPSKDEVEGAVSSLQHYLASASYSQLMGDGFSSGTDEDSLKQTSSPPGSMRRVSSVGSELDWIEPSFYLMPRSQGSRVYDAFRLLQNEPSVQRVVVSLSTDRAVWDAVLNNDVVRELRDSFEAENKIQSLEDTPIATKSVLSWIMDSSKEKLMELIDKVTKLFAEVFHPFPTEQDTKTTTTDVFQEKLRSSLLLSIVVLLIVVMTRAHRV